MAWISVHEEILGGKLRNLAKEIGCSQNEAIGILIRLWLWGINNADKYGMIVGAEKEDVAEVLSVGISKAISPVDVVDALIATSWIDMEDGLYIHDWEEWQDKWYKVLEYREKDAARKRDERKKKRMAKETAQSANTTSPSSAKCNDESEQTKKPAISYTKDFEDFWDVYPRKVGKGEAYKKYKARLKDGWRPEELLIAAQNYAAICMRNRTEKEYIKHAKTFLSDNTPFTDYIHKSNRGSLESGVQKVNEDDPFGDWRDD